MKRALKTTSLLIAILLLNFSCSKDDEVLAINLKDVKVTIDENPINGQILGKVESDNSGSLTFSITTQTPAGALSINTSTGELTVANATLFDFETNPTITATVSAKGALNKATVTISINNINELNILDFTTSIDENPTNGDTIGTVEATGDATLSYSITSQTPAGALSINASTGELTVADATLFDFETNPTITATVSVDNAGNTQDISVAITLNNVNELSVQNFTATIDENPTNGQSLGIVQATGDATLSYSITSQTPAGALSINASTGELTVANATLFDFETNPTITATVTINNAGYTQDTNATINLNNVNQLISVQNFTTTIDENPTNGSVLGTVQANSTGTLSFSIASQTPAGALSINANTGELTVADATLFDFETNPTITANISVNNSENTETATATIDLNDLINEIGEFKFGGIIFWLDPSDNSHGLVCAVSDYPTSVNWGCQGTSIAGAYGLQIGQGQANTTAILAGCSTTGIAADLASNSTYGGYTDWFLPSRYALKEIHTHRATINSTAALNGGSDFVTDGFYWSSTQVNSNTAWAIIFNNDGNSNVFNKGASANFYMRAVRAF